MRALIVFLAFWTAPAAAQVYKCTEGGVTTYAQKPCSEKAKPVDLNVYHPDRQEQMLARQRALADQRDARIVDRQREQLAVERQIDAQQRAQKEAAFKAKCDGYERTAKNARDEKELYLTQRFRDDADRRKREAEARHFSECYGEH